MHDARRRADWEVARDPVTRLMPKTDFGYDNMAACKRLG
jgi:hypothetical protein